MEKLLITGALKCSEAQIEQIKQYCRTIIYVQDERELIDFDVSDIEGVICNSLFLHNPIEEFKSLKYIQLTSAGFDRVPLDYIKKHGIKIHNARGVYSAPMAEFAVCGILQLIKQSRFFYENQKQCVWEKSRTLGELSDKTALIVGAGSIGIQVAKRLSAFDMNVVGVDITDDDKPYFSRVEKLENLDKELKRADAVILTLPLTEATKGLFDSSKFDIMKDSAVFVNIARGTLVVENDLINALENKKICGAVLDVFEQEPLDKSSPLWKMDNVILTPHNSFVGEYNGERMFETVIKNLEKL